MCTVTYIPNGGAFFLTSNRDEKNARLKAGQPQWYQFASGKILFPKDGNAGGTWIALHENSNAMVLLNGGFQNHQHLPPYRKSRGQIFLDVFDHPNPVTAFKQIELYKIEPFTLVIRLKQQLYETRWNGSEKSVTEIDPLKPHIWSSVTLYADEVIQKRKEWFDAFISSNAEIKANNILHFHRFGGDGDSANDVLMNRNNELFTVSISLLHQQNQISKLHYYDLLTKEESNHQADHSIPVTALHESA